MKLNSDFYNKKIKALFSRTTKLGLEGFRELCGQYGNPQTAYKIVHVAGTNGKGSVTLKIASALEAEGYKVGLYTSPHIEDFRERVQINGTLISEEAVLRLLADQEEGNFFELTTLLAFRWFKEQGVEWAVIETGLGGRVDATNIVSPELAIITSLALDHTEILGNSLDDIAYEKGGILKPTAHAILGPSAHLAEKYHPSPFLIRGTYESYEEENSFIAKKGLELLNVSRASIEKGILRTPPCRYEKWGDRIILDAAHNPAGMMALVKRLNQEPLKNQKRHIVLALSKTKEVASCIKALIPYALSFITTEAGEKTIRADLLKNSLIKEGFPDERITVLPSPSEAIKYAEGLKGPILVTGSFFIMHPIKKALAMGVA